MTPLFSDDYMKSLSVFVSFALKMVHVLCRLMDIAKEMTREALPIKCLEAVILGMYL